MSESYDHLRERAQNVDETRTSRRLREAVDKTLDPMEVPLDQINVANPELFKHQLIYPYFKRFAMKLGALLRRGQYGRIGRSLVTTTS